MLNTYFQTTEVTDSGYKIIVSNNNIMSDDELVAIFQNSEITKSSDSEFRVLSSGIALVKSGIQQDTGRTSQNILLINGVDSSKIKAEELEKLKALMADFFNNKYSTIKEEYKKSNLSSRKLIFVSDSMSEFEKSILQLNLPEKEIEVSQNNNKSYKKYIIVGSVLLFVFAIFVVQIVLAKGLKSLFRRGRKNNSETTITKENKNNKKEKISVENQLFEALKMSQEDFEKARLIEPEMAEMLLDENKTNQILNDIKENKLAYTFCPQNNISRFYEFEKTDKAQILKIRKTNIKLIRAIENFSQNFNNLDISEKRDFNNVNLILDPDDDKTKIETVERLKKYYDNISNNQIDFSIFRNYSEIAYPIFSDKDAKAIDLIINFFKEPNYSYGKWTENKEDWFKISNIKDLKSSFNNIELKNYEKLIKRINDSISATGKSGKRIIDLINLLINSKTEFLDVLEGVD